MPGTYIDHGKLWVQTKQHQHNKEKNWEKWGRWQKRQSFWISNKGKSRATFDDFTNWNTVVESHIAKERENSEASKDWRETLVVMLLRSSCKKCAYITKTHNKRVFHDWIIEFIVWGHCHQTTKGNTKWKENLSRSIGPYFTKRSALLSKQTLELYNVNYRSPPIL